MGSKRRNKKEIKEERGETREREKERRTKFNVSDLDSGYRSPIASWRDLKPKKLLDLLKNSRYTQLVLLLTIAGTFLRFYNLSYNSLWLDEAATLDFARHSYSEIWGLIAAGEFNPPLFYWIEHAMLVFGESEFVLRIVPAVAGIITIPVFYYLGREIVDRNAGIVAAALLTFSPFHLFYSQEARAYTLMLLFMAIAFLTFLIAIRTSLIRDWIMFGIFTSLSFWSNFYLIVPVAMLFLVGILWAFLNTENTKKLIKMQIISLVTFFILSLPLLVIMIHLFFVRTASAPTFGFSGIDLVWRSIEFISGFNGAIAVIFLIVFILGSASLLLSSDIASRIKGLAIVLLFIVQIISSLYLSTKMPMMPRHQANLLVVFFPGIAACIQPVMAIANRRSIVYIAIMLAFLSGVWFLPGYYSTYSKEDWRGFSDILKTKTKEGDVVIAVPSYMRLPLDYYYSNTSDLTIEYGATKVNELEDIRTRHADTKLYLVVTADIFAAEPEGQTVKWLEENAKLVTRYTNIHLFVSR